MPPAAGRALVAERTAVTYHVEWHGRVKVDREQQTFGAASGRVAITGDLVLRGLGTDGDVRIVGVSLGHLDEHAFVVQGLDLAADAHRLEGSEVVARLRADGSLDRLQVPAGVDDTSARVLAALVRELTFTVPPAAGAEWTVVEPGPSGRARAHYTVTADSSDAVALSRTREAYLALDALPRASQAATTLDAKARIVIAHDGTLRELEDLEHLTVAPQGAALGVRSTTHFLMTRTNGRALAGSELVPEKLSELAVIDPETARRRDLEQRTKGMKLEDIQRDITAFALTGIALRNSDMFSKQVAFMRLHPELCNELAAMADDPAINDRGLGSVLDVLASTGTPEAQSAMRDVLGSDRLANDATRRANAIARFSFIDAPDADSVAFLEDASRGDGPDAQAARLALGSARRHLAEHGDTAAADALDARLRDDLATAPPGPARLAAIVALGNARGPSDRTALEHLLQTGDADERAAAKTALERFDPTAKEIP